MKNGMFIFACLVLLSGGCSARYSCPAPGASACRPLGAVYRQLFARTPVPGETSRTTPGSLAPQPGDPLLTRPRQVRIWIHRWVDAEGDLHDESVLYLRLDRGEWSVQRPPALQP